MFANIYTVCSMCSFTASCGLCAKAEDSDDDWGIKWKGPTNQGAAEVQSCSPKFMQIHTTYICSLERFTGLIERIKMS